MFGGNNYIPPAHVQNGPKKTFGQVCTGDHLPVCDKEGVGKVWQSFCEMTLLVLGFLRQPY